MPLKKRSSSKKKKLEVLPDPATIPNGNSDYYIGSWSSYSEIDAITEIARSVVESHTAENGEVEALPRTNIIIPPGTLGEATMRYAVEVADNMHIESLSRVNMSDDVQVPAENKGEDEGLAEKEKSMEMRDHTVEDLLEEDQQDVGASKHACDVIIAGAVHIDGIITRIVIKPELPDPPVVPKVRRKSSISKKKAKLLEEQQKRLAEEAKIYEEKVTLAIAAAKKEEEYRMRFAHPDRWSKVEFSNMTFSGQVIVSHAHVTFRNCRFAAHDPDCTQLLVAQYCQVECLKCTFDRPAKRAVYGWPMGKLTLLNCIFTGVSLFSSCEETGEYSTSGTMSLAGAVGVQTDNCKLHVESCLFTNLSNAIVLHGSYKTATAEDSGAPAMMVTKCNLKNIYGTGVILEKVSGVELRKNKFSDCDYYALDCVKGKNICVFENKFYSKVRVQDGAHVKFLHNNIGVVPFSPKEIENPNWQPVY